MVKIIYKLYLNVLNIMLLLINSFFNKSNLIKMVLLVILLLIWKIATPELLAIKESTHLLNSEKRAKNYIKAEMPMIKKPKENLVEVKENIKVNAPETKIQKETVVKNENENNSLIIADIDINLPSRFELLAQEILAKLPPEHITSLKRIRADYGKDKRRGLGSFRSIYLGVDVIASEAEFKRVLIHEIGHVVDLGSFNATRKLIKSSFKDGSNAIYESDPSLDFYNLCWQDEYTLNNNCDDLDFVSEYAKTDPFEDFAESYLLFLENNESFIAMASENEIMSKKYDFLAKVIFKDNFDKTPAISLPIEKRVWDLTLVN